MTKNDSISIRFSGVYVELVKIMENFHNIMNLMNEIEEIIEDDERKQPFELLKNTVETTEVDEGGQD